MADFTDRVVAFCEQRAASGDEDDSRPTGSARRSPGRSVDRRRLLAAGGGAAATLLAGCSNVLPDSAPLGPGDDNSTDAPGTQSPASSPANASEGGTPTAETDVVGLVPKTQGSKYEFIVTLDPPNDGGGADWWQVETLDGSRVGRKEFDSPRRGGQFTSSKTMPVDSSVESIVVRGHDAAVGYGGKVMLLHLKKGIVDLVDQGPEKQSFADYTFEE